MSTDQDITVAETISASEILVIPAPEEAPEVIVTAEDAPVVVVSDNAPGANGLDAYQMALQASPPFVGTLEAWLASLMGAPGPNTVTSSTTSNLTGLLNADGSHVGTATPGVHYMRPDGSGAGLTSLSKSQVGLNLVDNTPDADKPVSTPQQTAINLKISHSLATAANDFLVASGVGAFVKKTLAEVKTILGLGSAAYTASTDYLTPLGNGSGLTGLTKTQVGLGNVQNLDQRDASNINTGTMDGDRLPALSATKRGGVPATGTPTGKYLKDDGTWAASGTPDTATMGALIDSATSKTPPVDADMIGLMDSADENILKKLSWTNLKATLKTYFDALYPSGSGTSTGSNTGDETDSTIKTKLGITVISGSNTGDETDATITTTDVTTNNASTAKHGWFPKFPSPAGKFFRDDGTWQTVSSGSGDVVGPASAVGDHVVFFDSTSGKLIKDSGLILEGSNTGDVVKASGAEIIAGTDDAKFVTAKGLADAGVSVPFVERVDDPSPGSVPVGYAYIRIDQLLLPTLDLMAGSAPDYNSTTIQIRAYLNASVTRLDFYKNGSAYTYATLSGGTWTSNDTAKVTVEDSATAKFNVLSINPDSDIITVKQTVNSYLSIASNLMFAVNLRTTFTPNITSAAGGSNSFWSGLRFSLAAGTIIRGIEAFVSKVTDGASYTAMKALRVRLYSGTSVAWVTQLAEVVYTPSANDKSSGFTPTESQFHWRGGLLPSPYTVTSTGSFWIVLVPGTGAAGDTDVLYRQSSETGTRDYRVWNGYNSTEYSFTANKRVAIRYW